MKIITLSYFLNISIVAILVIGIEYYLLVQDNFLHLSISAIIDYASHLELRIHLLVLGLLPIYISMVTFGAMLLGYYITSKIYSFLNL